MDFEPSDKVKQILTQLERFMDEFVYPAERVAAEQVEASATRTTSRRSSTS